MNNELKRCPLCKLNFVLYVGNIIVRCINCEEDINLFEWDKEDLENVCEQEYQER